jgi:hypothetical protein
VHEPVSHVSLLLLDGAGAPAAVCVCAGAGVPASGHECAIARTTFGQDAPASVMDVEGGKRVHKGMAAGVGRCAWVLETKWHGIGKERTGADCMSGDRYSAFK